MKLWLSPPSGEESFEALRERLFSNVISLMAMMTLAGLLVMVLRIRLLGVQPFMLVQMAALAGVVLLALLRERLSMRNRLLVLTACLLVYVSASTVQLGPAADSRGFLLFLAFLAGVFLSPRAGLLVTLLLLVWVAVLGAVAILWGLPLSLRDYASYSAHPSTWISMGVVLGTFSGIIGYVGAVLVQQLRVQAESVRQSETRLRGLFELSPIGITLNDLQEGRFLEVNPALLQMTGYDREGFLALEYWQLTPPRVPASGKAAAYPFADRGPLWPLREGADPPGWHAPAGAGAGHAGDGQ